MWLRSFFAGESLCFPNKRLEGCIFTIDSERYFVDLKSSDGVKRYPVLEDDGNFTGGCLTIFYGVIPRMVLDKELFLIKFKR
jgi:hypothetical protein